MDGQRLKRCPKCQINCRIEEIVPPIPQYLNLLNNLRIKCKFVENGCHEVVRLGSLSRHLEECIHKICDSCGPNTGPNIQHNCIEVLKRELIKSRKEYKKLSKFDLIFWS